MEDQVPADVASERYQRLIALQNRITLEENQKLIGERVDVLVSSDGGRKDASTSRITGRAADNRLVHIALPEGLEETPRPGDMVSAIVTHAAPYHLVADSALEGGFFEIRKTRAGDAYEAGERRKAQLAEEAAGRAPVALGIPGIPIRKN